MEINRKIRKGTVWFSAMVIVIFLLALINVWLLSKVDDYQQQVNKLSEDNANLGDQIIDLIQNNSYLQYEVNHLKDDIAKALNRTKRVHIYSCDTCPQFPGQKEGGGYFYAQYAGYLEINLTATDVEDGRSVYVEVTYSFNDEPFNFTKTYTAGPLGSPVGGTTIVPLLPSQISIRIGNTNLVKGPTLRFSINYYF